MKKLISLIGCFAMLFSFSLPALAAEQNDISISKPGFCADVLAEIANSPVTKANDNNQLDLGNSFYLYNFNDEPIAIFYQLSPIGYTIYDYTGKTVLEYTTESNHPFYNDPNQRYYYEGVFCYYEPVENGFRNLETGQVKSVGPNYHFDNKDFYNNTIKDEPKAMKASEGPVILSNSTRLYDCNMRKNFRYFYPDLPQKDLDDCPGVCGSLACSVLLAYYDDYHSNLGDFVDDTQKSGGKGVAGAYGKSLVKELVQYVEPNANGSIFLNPGVSSYLRDRGINGRVQVGVLSVYQQTKKAIGDGTGDPIIVGTTSHYSVGVGYQNITEKQIYTNNGHGGYTWINANTVVSTWTMHID